MATWSKSDLAQPLDKGLTEEWWKCLPDIRQDKELMGEWLPFLQGLQLVKELMEGWFQSQRGIPPAKEPMGGWSPYHLGTKGGKALMVGLLRSRQESKCEQTPVELLWFENTEAPWEPLAVT